VFAGEATVDDDEEVDALLVDTQVNEVTASVCLGLLAIFNLNFIITTIENN